MKRSRVVLLWLAAIAITVGSAAWQRRTGPSYPMRGSAMLGGETIAYRLLRTQNTGEPLPVRIRASAGVTGEVAWRRYPSDEPLQRVALARQGEELVAALPAQPPAGKLEYFVHLTDGEASVELPPATVAPRKGAVARFKGAVPAHVLVPHIATMFFGMLFANAAALVGARAARTGAAPGVGGVPAARGRRAPPRSGGAEVRLRRLVDRLAVRPRPDRQQDGDCRDCLGPGARRLPRPPGRTPRTAGDRRSPRS